ncbi:MAG: KH domain-containing protein [Cyanobacteria bacterium P01_A01_bin.123]
MSSSNSVPNPDASSALESSSLPDFEALVRFLVEPFLESREALSIDCEKLSHGSRMLIRVAFEGEDRGRVFGRGGRNIQAIRKVVEAVGSLSEIQVRMNVYGENTALDRDDGDRDRRPRSPASKPRRSPRPIRRSNGD